MRDLLVFCVVAAVVFFGVGEWRGWYLGIPSQTPIYVYKKSHDASATRRTINLDYLPLNVSGDVQDGSVTVAVYYERPFSYQTSRAARPETRVFERSYTKGQRISLNQVVAEGQGIYRVLFEFQDATGFFRLKLPTAAEL
jgi:hypothetical protein